MENLSFQVWGKKNGRKVKNSFVKGFTILKLADNGFEIVARMNSKNYEVAGHGTGMTKKSFLVDVDYNSSSVARHTEKNKLDTAVMIQIKGIDESKYTFLHQWAKSELRLFFFEKAKMKHKFVAYKKLRPVKAAKK